MNYKGELWRKVTLAKRRKKYLVADIIICLVWLAGLALISIAAVILFLTHNWQLPLIMFALGTLVSLLCHALDHGTITGEFVREKESGE